MAQRTSRAALVAACVAALGLAACEPGAGVTGEPLAGQPPGDGVAFAQAGAATGEPDADSVADADGSSASGQSAPAGAGAAGAGASAGAAGAAGAAGTAGAAGGTSGSADGGGQRGVDVPPLSARMPDGRQTWQAQSAEDPIGVVVPSIGVRAHTVRLGLDAQREMEVPDDFSLAGWYVHGPRPGTPGPAIIAGHVDGRRGPAVFYRLHELSPGEEIEVHRADDVVVTYVVDRVEQHPKDAFPTEAVYGNTPGPELRLITCGGTYDRRAGSHRDNIIVFARIVEG
jgi:hypothetical protein